MLDNSFVWNGISTTKNQAKSGMVYELFKLAKAQNWEKLLYKLEALSDAEIVYYINSIEPDSVDGNTILHYAALFGVAVSLTEYLIDLEASRSIRNKFSQHPLKLAIENQHQHLYPILKPVYKLQIPNNELNQIEANFHTHLLNSGDTLLSQIIQEQALHLPQLSPLLERDIALGWFPISGYYGRFEYRLHLDNGKPRLISHHSSRVYDLSSFQLHEISVDGIKSIAVEDDKETFPLYLKLIEEIIHESSRFKSTWRDNRGRSICRRPANSRTPTR